MEKKCCFKSKPFWFPCKYFFQTDISTEDISDYWKLLQNFVCLPDWPFPVGKCWFQWNSFPKEKSFWKVSIPALCQYMNPNMFKILDPVWERGERMCVGDRGVNTANSVFPRESRACSNLLELCSPGSGVGHRGLQLHSVHRVCAHWAVGGGGYH